MRITLGLNKTAFGVCLWMWFFFFFSKQRERREKPDQPSGLSREESNTLEYGKVASQLGRRSC